MRLVRSIISWIKISYGWTIGGGRRAVADAISRAESEIEVRSIKDSLWLAKGCYHPNHWATRQLERMCDEAIEVRRMEAAMIRTKKGLCRLRAEIEAVLESTKEEIAMENGTFGQAIEELKAGRRCWRKGWNGRGIFIRLQKPDPNSKMTSPYIFIDTTGLVTDNEAAPKSRVPWLASQTDMLAEDWCSDRVY